MDEHTLYISDWIGWTNTLFILADRWDGKIKKLIKPN